MQMSIGHGLMTWTDPATSSSSSDPPAVGSPGWCQAIKTSIRVDRQGLERFIKLFRMTDPTLHVKFEAHFRDSVMCSVRQERAAGLPKRSNASNVPRRSAEQQEEDGRWDSRNLKEDQALQADTKRWSKLKANMTLE
jgi:hypothetical protein